MDTKKVNEIDKVMLDAIAAGSAPVQESFASKENERALIMEDLLLGLSFGPVAPECTDAR